jgi:hypothetical protein
MIVDESDPASADEANVVRFPQSRVAPAASLSGFKDLLEVTCPQCGRRGG